jgi:hypothetical protein
VLGGQHVGGGRHGVEVRRFCCRRGERRDGVNVVLQRVRCRLRLAVRDDLAGNNLRAVVVQQAEASRGRADPVEDASQPASPEASQSHVAQRLGGRYFDAGTLPSSCCSEFDAGLRGCADCRLDAHARHHGLRRADTGRQQREVERIRERDT